MRGLQRADHGLFVTVCRRHLPAPDREMNTDRAAGPAWTGSWTGSPGIPAPRVLPVRFSVSSVLPVRSVHGAVVMVRRRSTVRFRNGAQGHGQFSNDSTRWRGPSPGDAPQLPFQLPLRREGPAEVTEGSHRRSFHGGPDHRRTSRAGNPRSPKHGPELLCARRRSHTAQLRATQSRRFGAYRW